jgi:hypothetical protein
MKFAHAITRRLARLTYREGLALVPGDASYEWPERMFLKRLLRRLEVDCVLDMGANLGQYATELRMIGGAGQVISFEPTPGLFAKIDGWSRKPPK